MHWKHSHPADTIWSTSGPHRAPKQPPEGLVRCILPLRVSSSTVGPPSVDNEGWSGVQCRHVVAKLLPTWRPLRPCVRAASDPSPERVALEPGRDETQPAIS